MMKKRKLLSATTYFGVAGVFRELFDGETVISATREYPVGPEYTLILEGGTDISPSIYSQKPGQYTQRSDKFRDEIEIEAVKRVTEAGGSIIGICRGAQLMGALLGGQIIQHVTGHGQSHQISTNDGREFTTSSLHHQMIVPTKEMELIAWSKHNRSKVYLDGDNQNRPDLLEKATKGLEPEILWHGKSKSLLIQGHPEFLPDNHEFVNYSRELVQKYILS